MSKSEKQILLQRIIALERLAKVGAASAKFVPKIKEIEAWSNELKEFVKSAK
jgi:hypothetical protein